VWFAVAPGVRVPSRGLTRIAEPNRVAPSLARKSHSLTCGNGPLLGPPEAYYLQSDNILFVHKNYDKF